MPFEEDLKKDIILRMRRVEGQARGIIKMVDEDRDCEEVLCQLAAIRAAVNKAGVRILSGNLMECLKGNSADDAARKAVDLFMKFS